MNIIIIVPIVFNHVFFIFYILRFSLYLLTLHDNELWFSEIMVSLQVRGSA